MNKRKVAIVCVDDDPVILKVLEYQLREIYNSQNILIETFISPKDFIDSIEFFVQSEISVIYLIVDFKMPEMNGAELIRHVKPILPKTEFIMISGQANENVVEDLKQEGLLRKFISKPWEIDDLRLKLDGE